ncbi:peptidyl-prolyl cis-trans isomerase FKBP8-like isoform X2 [Tachypleus tridentatus]|uniref:peptidyl-prolyl cis-trans isomerase FKBP8-like isoform X2 n=1 Tax=Tachypleus tridentatus TaxID=6853 RepID=UPI003FD177B4
MEMPSEEVPKFAELPQADLLKSVGSKSCEAMTESVCNNDKSGIETEQLSENYKLNLEVPLNSDDVNLGPEMEKKDDSEKISDDDDDDDLPSLEDIEKTEEEINSGAKCKPFRIEDEPTRLTDEDGWLDILGSGDLKKKVIKSGEGAGTRPQRSNWVTVKLTGKLTDGTVVEHFDSLKFILGDTDVVQGLDLAIALMEKGETAEIIVPSRLGYGNIGRPPNIPPDAELMYEVEIFSVEEVGEETDLPLEERMKIGDEKRERGNFWYGRSDYSNAIHCYRRSLDFLDDEKQDFRNPTSELQKLLDTRLKVYNNLAAAQLKMDAYEAALKSVDFVLKVQPQNVKALFRKGKILAAKGKNNEAIAELKKALKLEPETKIIHQELAKLMLKKKQEEKAEKAMYKRMFGTTNVSSSQPKSQLRSWSLIVGGIMAVVLGVAVYRQLHG